jgi:mono/diheme cytochrome c family protein
MTKRTAMWTLTMGLVALGGCSSDDSTGTGAGGSPGSGGTTGTGGQIRDGAVEADVTVHADAAGGSDAGPDVRADVSADASTDASQDVRSDTAPGSDGAARSDGEAGADAGLTPLQARGQYLVNAVIACSDCHTPQGPNGPDMTHFLAGNPDFVVLPNGDHLGSRNLTNDATGLKNRTDDEIKNMFMNGLRPLSTGTGTEALNPVMPYYVFHNMAPADADAIVAYLRTVPAVVNTIPQRGISFDLPAPANPLAEAAIPTPAVANDAGQQSALRGRYLAAESGLCIECHSQHQAGADVGADVLVPNMYFAGGEDFSAFFASTLMIHPVSKNLTSDVTGLSTWSTDDIVRVLKQGVAKDGTGICPPMPAGPMGAYGHLTDGDALDIANYIKSLPAISHTVVDMCVFPPAPPGDGGSTEGGADSTPGTDSASDSAATSDASGD